MKFSEEAKLRERIHRLVHLKATGTPEQLANRIGVSKRNLYRIINDMREDGFPIIYDRHRERYYYEKEVVFEIKFYVAGEKEVKNVVGGKNFTSFFDFFRPVPDSGTGMGFLCGR